MVSADKQTAHGAVSAAAVNKAFVTTLLFGVAFRGAGRLRRISSFAAAAVAH